MYLRDFGINFGITTVPIIPEFLYDIRHPNATLDSLPRMPLTTPVPCDRFIEGIDVTTMSAGKMHLNFNRIYKIDFIEKAIGFESFITSSLCYNNFVVYCC